MSASIQVDQANPHFSDMSVGKIAILTGFSMTVTPTIITTIRTTAILMTTTTTTTIVTLEGMTTIVGEEETAVEISATRSSQLLLFGTPWTFLSKHVRYPPQK